MSLFLFVALSAIQAIIAHSSDIDPSDWAT